MSDQHVRSRQLTARKRAAEILGAPPEDFTCPLTVVASPAWRGIEGDIWRASVSGRACIIKHYHPDTAFYVDTNAAVTAARQAGVLGVGPAVMGYWPQDAIFAMDDLGGRWRAGGLQHAVDRDIRSRTIAQKKAFQAGARLEKVANIFDEIENLYAITIKQDIVTHRDASVFLDFFREARRKLAAIGRDRAPCHRDGSVANLMIGPELTVRLLDFDLAADCDPFEDVGAYLVEFFESDADARGGFEEWHGTFNEGLFQRSMIYGLADDMRWGLIGAIMAATSPRSSLEFSKYSAWRFLRLEAHVKRSNANDRIRVAA